MFARTIEDHAVSDEAAVTRNRGGSGISGWEIVMGRLLLTLLVVLFIADWLLQPDKFQIEEILVHGESGSASSEQVKKVALNALDGNFFSLDLERLEYEVEQLPRVFSASLRRQWPSTIVINVVEAELAARWSTDRWVSLAGELVVRPVNEKWDHSTLAQLNGPEDQVEVVWDAFQQWSGKFAALGLSLDALSLSPTGLFDLRISPSVAQVQDESGKLDGQVGDMDAGITLIVESQNSRVRVQRFLEVLEPRLVARFAEMESIDLRYPNGFAIGWRDRETVSASGLRSGSI